jgi:molybdopterin-guanine dinucleotide biosynthesis protein B
MLRTPDGSPIIGIAGWKKSGKTTLTVRLVEEFVHRGVKVATLKHAHHAFDVDEGETDSARHRRAGAGQVAVVSGVRWALITELRGAPEPNFEEIIAALDPTDLVIVEGYKSAPIAKIEARRIASKTRTPLADDDPLVIAIASDHPTDANGLPVFDPDDITGMADFIEKTLGPIGRHRITGRNAGASKQIQESE